jgi:hypothetical protein
MTDCRSIRRLPYAWRIERIAPGHCTGEPAFAVLSEVLGERYVFVGLGDSITACNKLSYELNNRRIDAAKVPGCSLLCTQVTCMWLVRRVSIS